MNYLWIIAKVILLYLVIIFFLRILGKREIGELSILDLVVLLVVADIASISIDNDAFVIPSLVCLVTLGILQKGLSLLLLKFSKMRMVVDGNPRVLVVNGVIKYNNFKKELYTVDDLISQMRAEHIMDVTEIKLAILETTGILSLFRTSQFDQIVLPIIVCGSFDKENLEILETTQEKIEKLLHKNNVDLKKVIYASYGKHALLYYYKENNKVKDIKPQVITL